MDVDRLISALFDLIQAGWLGGAEEGSGSNWLGKLAALTLGGSGTPGSCASLVSAVQW